MEGITEDDEFILETIDQLGDVVKVGGVIIVLNPDDPEQHEMHDKMAVTLKKKGFTVAHVKSKSPHPDSPDGDAYLLKSGFTTIKKGGK